MNPDEIENAEETANDVVERSDDDNLDDFVYHDPDEDQDNEEIEETDGTDDETDEAKAENEAEDQESEDQQDDDDPETVTVKLDDGTEVSLSELKSGYFRQADYSRKTAEVAEKRKTLEASTQRIEGVTQAFVDHLASLLPPEPDPALVYSDPNKHYLQSQQYNTALAQVQKLIDLGSQAKEVSGALSESDAQAYRQAEAARLAEMFPATANPKTRDAFIANAREGAKAIGFTDAEMDGIDDSKVIALAHWAKIGMDAQKAGEKAKAKAQKAPPASPQKPARNGTAAKNADAMRKLKQTGSLDAAMMVDFD